jgi:plasmid replication initiation protein
MYTETDKKIDNLSKEDKFRFYSELTPTLDNCPTIERIEEAKDNLYKKMFENYKEAKKDN